MTEERGGGALLAGRIGTWLQKHEKRRMSISRIDYPAFRALLRKAKLRSCG
jgi:hypothetical protein